MNASRVGAIAKNVFWEVIRDRVLYLIGLYALLMVFAGQFLPQVAGGAEAKILLDLSLAAIEIFGLVIAVFVGTGLINKEIDRRTVLVLIAKPMRRSEFIVGKHLGLSAVLAVLVILMTAIALTILQLGQIAYPLGSLLLSTLYTFLQLSLITAATLMFGVFTSSLLAALLTFGVYLMGHFSQDLVELGKLTENPGIQRVTQGAYLVLPDLSRLDLKNQAVYSLLPDPSTLLENAIYGIVYTVLLLTIATMIFARREF